VLLNKYIHFSLCTRVCSNFDSYAILNSQAPKIFCPLVALLLNRRILNREKMQENRAQETPEASRAFFKNSSVGGGGGASTKRDHTIPSVEK
jgi:hypothetical protein